MSLWAHNDIECVSRPSIVRFEGGGMGRDVWEDGACGKEGRLLALYRPFHKRCFRADIRRSYEGDSLKSEPQESEN